MSDTLNSIKRMVIALICGLVLLLLGYAIIDRLLASDRLLIAKAVFEPADNVDWQALLKEQQQLVKSAIVEGNLAHNDFNIKYNTEIIAPNILEISLCYSVRYDQNASAFFSRYDNIFNAQKEKFAAVLADYKDKYADKTQADRLAKNLQEREIIHKNRQKDLEIAEKQLESQAEYIERQQKYLELQQGTMEILAAEAIRLNQAIEEPFGLAYQAFVQRAVQNALKENDTVLELQAKQQEYRNRQAQLDIKAGQAEDSLLLAAIDVERRELAIARQQAERQIVDIANELKEKLAKQLSQQYQREQKIQRDAKEQEIQRLQSSVIAAKGNLENAQSQYQSLMEHQQDSQQKYQLEIAEIEEIRKLATSFRPGMTISEVNDYIQLSIIQSLALTVLALLGIALGWTLAPMGNKIYLVQKGKRLSPSTNFSDTIPASVINDYETMARQVLKLEGPVNPIVLLTGYGSPVPVVNLGIALAKEGKNILIIEAQGNQLSEVFDIDTDKGYRQWLLGQSPAEEFYQPTSLAGLTFMPAGKISRGENSDQTSATIGWLKLRKQFDVIVIFSPGTLKAIMHNQPGGPTVEAADAVFVQSAEKMNKKGIAILQDKLMCYELPLLGIVDN